MVRGHAPPLNPVCGGSVPKGRLCSRTCPFFGVSCFQKKAFPVLGTVFGGLVPRTCPFFGVSCFQKKAFPVLGTVFGGLVPRTCPFFGVSCFQKKAFGVLATHFAIDGSSVVIFRPRPRPALFVVIRVVIKFCPRRVIHVRRGVFVRVFLP